MALCVTLYLDGAYSWPPKWNNVKLYKVVYIGLKISGFPAIAACSQKTPAMSSDQLGTLENMNHLNL